MPTRYLRLTSIPNPMAPLVEDLPFHHELHIPVSIQGISTVLPATPTPSTPLFLSNIDDATGINHLVTVIYFYEKPLVTSAGNPTRTLREALSKVLVPYYPFSGRLRKTGPNKKHQVHFPPDEAGAWFVEAYTDTTLSELGPLNVPNPSWRPLAYTLPEEPSALSELPLLIAQVTMFRCGGLSLAVQMSHRVCDGMGCMQVMAAWSVTARMGSVEAIDPAPCWERDFFRARDPPRVEFLHPECNLMEERSNLHSILADDGLVPRGYRLSREFQARIKQLGTNTDDGAGCTTFDKLVAHVWRCWVKAWGIQPMDEELQLLFPIDLRRKLANPPLPPGFYGNAICVVSATSSVRRLVLEDPLWATARLVRDARSSVTVGYVRSIVDYIEEHWPIIDRLRGKMMLSQWTRLPMYDTADFGFGRPVYVGPCDRSPLNFLLLPENDELAGDGGGAIVVWICMTREASSKFAEYLLQIPS